MYIQRSLIYPQLGKAPELRQILETQVKLGQSQGRKVGLATQLFSPDGLVFVVTVLLNDLAELEQLRQRQSADPAFQDFLAKTAALSRIPARQELLETIVPLNN